MNNNRFLQVHTLHGYPAALLNRDDSGLAKRINYGGTSRTRISSQCLKRHWRFADGPWSLREIDGAEESVRSRETVTKRIVGPLREDFPEEVVQSIENAFQKFVYGEEGGAKKKRQTLLLGEPEISYLAGRARKIAETGGLSEEKTARAWNDWKQREHKNLKAMRENCQLPAGLIAALCGRMVTSDPEANIEAALHVSHAFTVHEEESESDYFTAVDDLQSVEEDEGADHINETELHSGLFYGYVVLDIDMLIRNLGGDVKMAAQITERVIMIIATQSPGAKLGSTAPYSYASWLLAEAGDWQPRSLAEAFRDACKKPLLKEAEVRIAAHLEKLDEAYGSGEARKVMSLEKKSVAIPRAEHISLSDIARWAGEIVASRGEK